MGGGGVDNHYEVTWGSRLDFSANYSSPLTPAEMVKKLNDDNFDVILIHHSIPYYAGRNDEDLWTCEVHDDKLWWEKMYALLDMGVAGTWQDIRRADVSNARVYSGIQKHLGKKRRTYFIGNYDLFRDCCWTRHYMMSP